MRANAGGPGASSSGLYMGRASSRRSSSSVRAEAPAAPSRARRSAARLLDAFAREPPRPTISRESDTASPTRSGPPHHVVGLEDLGLGGGHGGRVDAVPGEHRPDRRHEAGLGEVVELLLGLPNVDNLQATPVLVDR